MVKAGRISPLQSKSRIEVQSIEATEQTVRFPAPIRGLITSELLDNEIEASCCVLENFIPTSNGVRVRGGSVKRVNVPSAVKYLFAYTNITGFDYFACTDTNIYKYTDATADGTILTTPSLATRTNADYSHLETQTDGGSFLLLVNGTDNLQVYNGTNWQLVNGSSTPFSITGVNTNLFSHVWNYNNRVFYIQKNSFNAWYMPINSIGGLAVKLPLTGIFKNGGFLLFGATISSDSGDGFNDRCVFVTTKGEFAVYSGDPSSVNSWKLDGVFNLGYALGKNSYIKTYGDLLVATRNGLLSINSVMQGQPTSKSISQNIKKDWQNDVLRLQSNDVYKISHCNNSNLVFIALPSNLGVIYVLNLDTMAWSKIKGWNVNTLMITDCNLFFGGSNGWVYLGDSGGYDDGKLFDARLCYNFLSLGSKVGLKITTRIKESWRYSSDFISKVSVNSDYNVVFQTPPNVITLGSVNSSKWDIAKWDLSSWGNDSDYYLTREKWVGVTGQGEVIAPIVQLSSAQPYKLNCELIAIDVAYKAGRAIT